MKSNGLVGTIINQLICWVLFFLTCIEFDDLTAWGGCWFIVYKRRFIDKFLNVCPFDYTAVAESGNVLPVYQVNHTSWLAVVTPTDRPKSVHNRSVIELFCGLVCVVTLPFWHFCWCRGFCHRTESDLFLFLLRCEVGHCPWLYEIGPITNPSGEVIKCNTQRLENSGTSAKAIINYVGLILGFKL